MAVFLFSNFANTTLAAPITAGAGSLTVQSGDGGLFPNPSASQQFAITLEDAATGLIREIMYCTSRTGDILTVDRAQEGTSAAAWIAGDLVYMGPTAGQMQAMLQTAALQPFRIITASGAFVTNTTDANGAIGLNRTSGVAVSSTSLPLAAQDGDTYSYEDLAGNFNAFPLTIAAPAGMTIAGLPSVTLNVNRQSSSFRFYGSNIWSVRL